MLNMGVRLKGGCRYYFGCHSRAFAVYLLAIGHKVHFLAAMEQCMTNETGAAGWNPIGIGNIPLVVIRVDSNPVAFIRNWSK